MVGLESCINRSQFRSSHNNLSYDRVHQRAKIWIWKKDYSKEKERPYSPQNHKDTFLALSSIYNDKKFLICNSEESNINRSPEDSCQRDLNDKGSHSREDEGESAVAPKVTDNTPNYEENLQPEKDNLTAHDRSSGEFTAHDSLNQSKAHSEYNDALRNEIIKIPTIAENQHIASNCKSQHQDLKQFVSSASEEKLITTPSKRSPQQTPLIDRVGRVADTQLDACGHKLQKEKIRTEQQNVPEEMRCESKELNQVQGDHSDLPTRDKPYETSVKTMDKQKPPNNGGCTKADLLENVMNVTISAKEAKNFEQIEHCAAHVRENFGEFLCSSSLKSCKSFLRYFGTNKEERKVLETAILLAVNNPKVHGLITHILKQQLNVFNCVSIAVFCSKYGFDELKVEAELVMIEKYSTVAKDFLELDFPLEWILEFFEKYFLHSAILHQLIISFAEKHQSEIKKIQAICAGKDFKTVDMDKLKQVIENRSLGDPEKLQLVEGMLRCDPLTSIGDEDYDPRYQEADVEIMKKAARLSLKCCSGAKYQAFTAHCHSILKRDISDTNCISRAIFAHLAKLDELKVWAQYHLIVNFRSILQKYSEDVYPKRDLRDFHEISSIPSEFSEAMNRIESLLNGTDGAGNEPDDDQSVAATQQEVKRFIASFDEATLLKKAFDWALSQLRKLSSIKTKTIGKKGGTIELDGCSLTFPEGALEKDTDITMTVSTDPEKFPTSGMPITPILGVEPSRSFEKPIKVRMETCFAAPRDHRIPAQVATNNGSGWEVLCDVNIGSRYMVSFDTCHFSDKEVNVITMKDGNVRLKNHVSIHRTGLITSSFYLFDKDMRAVMKLMREKSCASFCPHSLPVTGKRDESLRLELELSQPAKIFSQEEWLPDEFSIEDVYEKQAMHTDVDPGTVVTSLPEGEYIRGTYKVFVGSARKPAASGRVKQSWPVLLDPESKDVFVSDSVVQKMVIGGTTKDSRNNTIEIFSGK